MLLRIPFRTKSLALPLDSVYFAKNASSYGNPSTKITNGQYQQDGKNEWLTSSESFYTFPNFKDTGRLL